MGDPRIGDLEWGWDWDWDWDWNCHPWPGVSPV